MLATRPARRAMAARNLVTPNRATRRPPRGQALSGRWARSLGPFSGGSSSRALDDVGTLQVVLVHRPVDLLPFRSRRVLRRARFNAYHAARCVACQGVGSHPVPVALVGECSIPASSPQTADD